MVGTKRTLWKRLTSAFPDSKSSGPSQKRSEESQAFRRRRVKEVVLTIPHYFRVLARIRRPSEVYGWAYFKFPYLFPLLEFPLCLSVEVTNKCNFSCRHCYRHTAPRPQGEMEVALFEKIVREVSQHRSFRWLKLLGAGEAAVHSRFRELMALLVRHTIPSVMYTNGSLLRLYPHREILSWGFQRVVVSVDGVDAEDYERIRVGGNYAALRKALMDFYKCRNSSGCRSPVIEIHHVIMPNETATQLLQFSKTWLETADSVKFGTLSTGPSEFEDPSRPKCRHIRREIGIRWDGTVPVCGGRYWRDSLGNIHHSTVSELWRHPRIENMRRCHECRDFAPTPACLKCRQCN